MDLEQRFKRPDFFDTPRRKGTRASDGRPPLLPHPEQEILEAPAGTVVVFNSHVWHGGTINRTQFPRRAIHSYFCRRDQPTQTPQKKLIRPETLERITNEARWLLDV